MNKTLEAYLACALWSSSISEYAISDFSIDAIKEAQSDVFDFVNANQDLITKSELSEEQVGHDFWLTRNGHGAGFWDRGLGKIGQELTENCKPYGSCDLYVSDDGHVNIM